MSHTTEFEAQGVLREKKEKKSKGKESREERRQRKAEKEAKRQHKEDKEAKRQRKAEKDASISKKRKHEQVDKDTAERDATIPKQFSKASDEAASVVDTPATDSKKSKRRKQSKTTADDADGEVQEAKATHASNGEAPEGPAEEPGPGAKSQRFICFIGNLPYTATVDSVTAHFSKVSPTSVRLMTDKATGKPKGFAFIEFDHYDRMKTCLQLYHHSSFDDGIAQARKINVELTAGGGGKSEARKEKLQVKNERLSEQRKRRLVEEEKQKARREKKGKGKGQATGGNVAAVEEKGAAQSNGTSEEPRSEHDSHGIHPSRLARMA